LLVETIFDTLNAKAAFFAIDKFFEDRQVRLPLMASVTFIQAGSNRGVTGQTIEAFWNSISHVPLLSVGINCALGPKEMRPLIEELSRPDLCELPSECRAAQSVAADGVSRDTRELGAAIERMGAEWLVKYRRRLLWNDPRTYQADC